MPVSVVCESAVSTAIRDSLPTQTSATLSCATAAASAANASQCLRSPQAGGSGMNDAGGGDDLQNRMSAKRVLLQRIEYEESANLSNTVLEPLKKKYILLKSSPLPVNGNTGVNNIHANKKPDKETSTQNVSAVHKLNQLPQPKRVLFPRENIHIGWKSSGHKWNVGSGFQNNGTTCYLNATLQALYHVPSFANWLRSDGTHRERCEQGGGGTDGCIICAVSKTLLLSQSSHQAIRPSMVTTKLRMICKHLHPDRQEDAHEFLRYLIEAMEKSYLNRFKDHKSFDQYSKETTPLNQILGGYLKTSVKCLSCKHVSTTFQHFEDILLDIRKADSVSDGLESYFAQEYLEDMGYKCEACKKKVSATKQFSLERPPIVLCIQLKRFSPTNGGKISRSIAVGQKLDLSSYTSNKHLNQNLTYKLVSMVTHLGLSQNCGHYTAIGCTESGNYYTFDDCIVSPISEEGVLKTNSYIMFYELDQPSSNKYQSSSGAKTTSTMTSKDSSKIYDENSLPSTNGPKKIVPTFIGPRLPPQNGGDPIKLHNGQTSTVKIVNNLLGSKLVTSPLKVGPVQRTDNKVIVYKNQQPPAGSSGGVKRPATTAVPLPPPSPKMQALSQNGHDHKKTPQYDSDESNRNVIKRKSLPSMPKLNVNDESTSPSTSATKPVGNILMVNGHGARQVNGVSTTPEKPRRLVPYDSDDEDSSMSDNDESKSPPIFKTKTGVWQVTTAPDSPPRSNQPKLSNPFATSPVSSTGGKEKTLKKTNSFTEVDTKIQKDETVSYLLKMSHRGYGAPVQTWNGQKTSLEKEVQEEKRDEKRRQHEMEEETEMDRGRVKKTKWNQQSLRETNPGFNPYQEQQNQQNGQRRNFSNGSSRSFNTNGGNFRQNNGSHHRGHQNFRGRRGGGGQSNGNSNFNRSHNNFHNNHSYQRNENNYHQRD